MYHEVFVRMTRPWSDCPPRLQVFFALWSCIGGDWPECFFVFFRKVRFPDAYFESSAFNHNLSAAAICEEAVQILSLTGKAGPPRGSRNRNRTLTWWSAPKSARHVSVSWSLRVLQVLWNTTTNRQPFMFFLDFRRDLFWVASGWNMQIVATKGSRILGLGFVPKKI